jgi:hypothetical protein
MPMSLLLKAQELTTPADKANNAERAKATLGFTTSFENFGFFGWMNRISHRYTAYD